MKRKIDMLFHLEMMSKRMLILCHLELTTLVKYASFFSIETLWFCVFILDVYCMCVEDSVVQVTEKTPLSNICTRVQNKPRLRPKKKLESFIMEFPVKRVRKDGKQKKSQGDVCGSTYKVVYDIPDTHSMSICENRLPTGTQYTKKLDPCPGPVIPTEGFVELSRNYWGKEVLDMGESKLLDDWLHSIVDG